MMIKYLLAITGIVLFFLIYRKLKSKLIDIKYGFTRKGHDGGKIRYKQDGKVAEIDWDMLMGEDVFVIYNENLQWLKPEIIDFTHNDKKSFYRSIDEWSAKRKLKYVAQYNRTPYENSKRKHHIPNLPEE